MPSAKDHLITAIRRFLGCFSAGSSPAGADAADPVPVPAGSVTRGGGDDAPSLDASTGGGDDLIGSMPDQILSSIVSLLPVTDAARTAVLSSQWHGLWSSTPLVFQDSDLILARNFAGVAPVAEAVSRIIESHPGPFRTVTLTSYFPEAERDTFAGWIRAVAAKGVRDLTLHNIPWSGLYVLPSDLLHCCSSLERLHVRVWRFPATTGVLHRGGDGTPPSFPHLRELVLNRSSIEEVDLENMVACSPAMQTLVFVFSWGVPERVRLVSGSLRCVMLWQSVVAQLAVVAAPLLERIVLWGSSGPYYGYLMRIRISRASSIKAIGYLKPTAHRLQIDGTVIKPGLRASPEEVAVPSVKILGLQVRFGVAAEARMVSCLLRCFPNVETLHLMPVEDPRCPALLGDFEFWEDINSVECVRYSIKKVVFHGFSWKNSEIAFINSIIEGGLVLEKIYIFFRRPYDTISDEELNAKLSMVASLSIGLGRTEIIFSGEDQTWYYKIAADLSRADPFDCS
ncbi:hypothetical protein E2562_008105 [Oryza meyeriana var. granulata]|uniref:Uncharacterized protein n=1 Tax=Oryza meyeriana var. granulata TaxID=110450 RepID=A0A6G1CFH4_9ORYZ|nr:hypothetical protein E2562_008105 [Oryza meyeriana var. granulata]